MKNVAVWEFTTPGTSMRLRNRDLHLKVIMIHGYQIKKVMGYKFENANPGPSPGQSILKQPSSTFNFAVIIRGFSPLKFGSSYALIAVISDGISQ